MNAIGDSKGLGEEAPSQDESRGILRRRTVQEAGKGEVAGTRSAGTARAQQRPGHLRGRLFRRPSPRGRTTEAVPLREPGRSRLTPSSAPDPGGAALLARRLSGSRLRASASADADSPAAAEVAAALPWRSIGAPSRPAPIRSCRRCRPSQPPSAASPSPRSPLSAGARELPQLPLRQRGASQSELT